MKLSDRIDAFGLLGETIHGFGLNERKSLAEKASNENPWFTEASVLLALRGVEVMLEKGPLLKWAMSYSAEPLQIRTVGVAMAGNIPLVGFHDFLCVLISGHRLRAKLSRQDSVLLKILFEKLREIEPRFSGRVNFEENVKGVDAMIATGSDNTSRYFEYYFRNIPHLIRKNRASCAVILGEEPKEEWELLGADVFSYFGLGCRNVAKLYIPEEFELRRLLESWQNFNSVIHHHKYANNYDYQKAILLVNREPHLDNEFLLLKESLQLVSPVGTLYYEKYKSLQELEEKIASHHDKLQIVVSAQGWFKGSVPFGKAQLPAVSDYADHIDTMKFLLDLN